MTTGIVRRIDDLGRICIPQEVRKDCGIQEGDPLEIISIKKGEVLLRLYHPEGFVNWITVSAILKTVIKDEWQIKDKFGNLLAGDKKIDTEKKYAFVPIKINWEERASIFLNISTDNDIELIKQLIKKLVEVGV